MKRLIAWFLATVLAVLPFRASYGENEQPESMPLLREVKQLLAERGLGGEPAVVERALISALLEISDPNAVLWSEAELENHMQVLSGYRQTPGLLLKPGAAHPVVEGTVPGSPAAGKFQQGDVIRLVNGRTVGNDVARLYRLLHRDTDTPQEIEIMRGEETITLEIQREWQQMPPVKVKELLPRSIVYVALRGFYGDADEIVAALTAHSETDPIGRIIDLRCAVGTDLSIVDAALNLLQKRHDHLYTIGERKNGEQREVRRTGDGIIDEPVMILLGPETRGAAEVFAAAATRCRQVLLIGSASYGDMLVREGVELTSGDILYLASKVLVVGETSYLGDNGVEPDINVSRNDYLIWSAEEEDRAVRRRRHENNEEDRRRLRERVGDDAVLQRAVELLLGLEALRLN